MTTEDREKIEESHGLWEPSEQLMKDAVIEERDAFHHWKDISRAILTRKLS